MWACNDFAILLVSYRSLLPGTTISSPGFWILDTTGVCFLKRKWKLEASNLLRLHHGSQLLRSWRNEQTLETKSPPDRPQFSHTSVGGPGVQLTSEVAKWAPFGMHNERAGFLSKLKNGQTLDHFFDCCQAALSMGEWATATVDFSALCVRRC